MQVILAIFSGFSLGWLTGLSISPVIASVIAALLAAGLGLSKLIYQSDSSNSFKVISVITIGVAAGATSGLYVRTNNILIMDDNTQQAQKYFRTTSDEERNAVKDEIIFWETLGINGNEIREHIFNKYISNSIKTSETTPTPSIVSQYKVAGLYSSRGQGECNIILNSPSHDTKAYLQSSSNVVFKVIGHSSSDAKDIFRAVNTLCRSDWEH